MLSDALVSLEATVTMTLGNRLFARVGWGGVGEPNFRGTFIHGGKHPHPNQSNRH